MPPASLSRYLRHNRSVVNRAANRLLKAEGVFALAVGCIGQRVRQEEAALGRELLPDELEAVCERVGAEDWLRYIREAPCSA